MTVPSVDLLGVWSMSRTLQWIAGQRERSGVKLEEKQLERRRKRRTALRMRRRPVMKETPLKQSLCREPSNTNPTTTRLRDKQESQRRYPCPQRAPCLHTLRPTLKCTHSSMLTHSTLFCLTYNRVALTHSFIINTSHMSSIISTIKGTTKTRSSPMDSTLRLMLTPNS